MAKKKAKQQKAASAPRPKRSLTPINITVVVLAVSVVFLPTMIVLVVGMLPTIVTLLMERKEKKYAWICVGGVNLGGVTPSLANLWFGEHSMGMAWEQISDVWALVLMYGSAAFGWALYTGLPPVIGIFISLAAKQKISQLKAQQRHLVEDWGNEVTGG